MANSLGTFLLEAAFKRLPINRKNELVKLVPVQ